MVNLATIIRLSPLDCELFDQRHANHKNRETGEALFNDCHSSHVVEAFKDLNITEWPLRAEASAFIEALQARLDIILRKGA